ncbi:signal peptidase I [Nesterenkonia marinintestina]|uniref:signal peptidase I n=1 Tax=Nesterenkonia marinintestina TaxID=2979865 RepID=UPI0021C0B9F4|nr:signal peptidase I [Nesterenkonia sp. GX14115]
MAEDRTDGAPEVGSRKGRRREREEKSAARGGRRRMPFALSLLLNILVALVVLSVIQHFWVKVYAVPSGSMETTLEVGDRMLTDRTAYSEEEMPQRQDVVVYNADEEWEGDLPSPEPSAFGDAVRSFGDVTSLGPSNEQALVKRVIGLPGEEIECCDDDGRITVDGEPLDEPYVFQDLPFTPGEEDCSGEPMSMRCFGPVTVPEGQLLVLGDHRSNSADSVIACRGLDEDEADDECARFVDREDVVGRVFVTVWPPTGWGGH